jgi:hypothetical protein
MDKKVKKNKWLLKPLLVVLLNIFLCSSLCTDHYNKTMFLQASSTPFTAQNVHAQSKVNSKVKLNVYVKNRCLHESKFFELSLIIEGAVEKVSQFIMPLKSIYNKTANILALMFSNVFLRTIELWKQ